MKKFQTIPAPRKFAESSLRGGPLGAIEFGGLAGLPLVHVLNLVIGDEPERLIQDFTPSILAEPDQVVEGTSYRVLRLDESDNHDWRFLIDPKTGLLAFVDLVVEGDATKSSIAGGDTHVESLRWAAGAVSTEPRGAEAFTFQPPAGFTGVAKLEGAAKAEAPAAHPLVGKPAPDFSVDVLDGPGKTRKVTRADLAGKVVLLDFWATWCAPCLEELPDVQKLIESYAKAKKDVVVLALSIDRAELGDLKEAREKVEPDPQGAQGHPGRRGEPGRPGRPRPAEQGRPGLRCRGDPVRGPDRRQGDRPIGPRRADRGVGLRRGDRRPARGQADGEAE